MTREAHFWRNVVGIGVAHVALLYGLARWSSGTKERPAAEILWLEGGAESVAATSVVTEASPPAEPEITATPAEPSAPPEQAPLASDIQLPAPTPSPAPSATATPTPFPTLTPRASPTPQPTPTPKSKATPTPKPKPKASPTPRKKPAEPTPKSTAKPAAEATPVDAKSDNSAAAGESPGA